MKCEHADLLIMKYMDEEISEEEARRLNAHLSTCKDCRESFFVFDAMLTDMKEIPCAQAPSGFEEVVMSRIMALPKEEKRYVYSRQDKLKIAFVGSFTFLLSVGAILISYRDMIVNTLAANPYTGEFVRKLIPVLEIAEEHSGMALGFVERTLNGVENLLSAGAGIFAAAIVALCGLQYVLVRRKNR